MKAQRIGLAEKPTGPELQMDEDGRWTTESLRDHFRYQISHMDGMDRARSAYATLDALLNQPEDGLWTLEQMRAVAEGFRLGMNEGIR